MRIFITGIVRFLGIHLVDIMVKDGHQVIRCESLKGIMFLIKLSFIGEFSGYITRMYTEYYFKVALLRWWVIFVIRGIASFNIT